MCEEITIKRYTHDRKSEWDEFVKVSKNGTFLFLRDYMDYHADRFIDHSLMFYNHKQRLVALLPANIVENSDGTKTLYSHQGLTYGGLVVCKSTIFGTQKLCFEALKTMVLQPENIAFVYKQMPSCYHLCPAEEDEYILWSMGASVSTCQISSTLQLQKTTHTQPFSTLRKRGIKRAKSLNYIIHNAENICEFWKILEQNLKNKHNAQPIHSLAEMQSLMQKFPDNIKCFVAERNGKTEAGTIIYETQQTAHTQYISASEQGKHDGALDLLFATLIDKYTPTHRYFDFGTSNEQGGKIVNGGLINQKEGFGARGIAYKQWTLNF